jgi:flagellin
MASINTNIASLVAQKNMAMQNTKSEQAVERISSGLRINSASDDAAGSAIASKMESQVRSLSVAIRNSHDAISMTQTAEGALGEMENILQRVRELSVQAGNSTLSASDRTAIQSEVTALTAEMDDIAKTTNFNGVNLLNGSNDSVTYQTGINASDNLEVKLGDASSRSLGLSGSNGVTTFTSERVVADDKSGVAEGDVKINGKNMLSTALADISSSTEAAGAVADAINLNTGVHGAVATAFNEVTSSIKATFVMSATFTVNTQTIAIATSREALVADINLQSNGVQARLNSDTSITLFNDDGGEIIVAGSGAADVGFVAETYEGYVSLTNIDGSAVSVEAASQQNGYPSTTTADTANGTTADVAKFNFNETAKDGKSLESNAVSTAVLFDTDLVRVNDVLIGSSTSDSAASKALAINKLTSEHGVTASAKTQLSLDITMGTAPGATEFEVMGTVLDISGAKNVNDISIIINNSTSVGDVVASASATGLLVLDSASGQNIVVKSTESGLVISAEDGNDTVLSDTSSVYTSFGTINLASADGSLVKLSEGNGDAVITHTGLVKLGFGGQSEKFAVSEQGLNVESLAAATSSLAKIDKAIDELSAFRSSFGAVENRIDAKINNMTTLKVNTQAAQSRIEDADFAAETTNMTKAQILSQAATSMLAQANSSKQNLLALLQG